MNERIIYFIHFFIYISFISIIIFTFLLLISIRQLFLFLHLHKLSKNILYFLPTFVIFLFAILYCIVVHCVISINLICLDVRSPSILPYANLFHILPYIHIHIRYKSSAIYLTIYCIPNHLSVILSFLCIIIFNTLSHIRLYFLYRLFVLRL